MSPEQLKRTPLYQKHLQLGAKLVPFAGWEMPVSYPAGIIAEHTAVRTSAGLFDIGHMGLIKIEGDQALALLQKVATNDAANIEMNACQYSVICNPQGGVIDDILVYRLPVHYLIVANAVNAGRVLSWLKQNDHGTSVDLYDNYAMLSLQGPQAVEIAARVLNAPLAALKHNHTLWWKDIILSRTGYTGEDGVEMIVAKSEIPSVWGSFINEGVQPCGLGSRDTLRLEAGLPLYGHEYDEATTPLEAGYSWAVKFDKGDFVGRDALFREMTAGLKKKLVGLALEGRAIPRQGNSVLSASGQVVGAVTSGTFSPTKRVPIALAYVRGDFPFLLVEIRGEKVTAKIVDKQFYKRVK